MTGPLKTALICLSLLLSLALGPRPALEAQTEAPEAAARPASGAAGPPPKTYTGEKISLNFKDAQLHNVIRIIGEISGKNIVVSDEVDGRITVNYKDMPWDQALDLIMTAQNLGLEKSGNVWTVYNWDTLQKLRNHRPRLSSHDGYELSPDRQPLEKKVFTPKYAPIGQAAAELKKLKSERGKIVAIGNDIYVEDRPEAMAVMNQMFIRIDRVLSRQILIEARIVEADAAFIESLAADWKGGGPEPGRSAPGAGAAGQAGGKAKQALLTYDFLSKKGTLYLDAAISASESTSNARTIAAPRIMAVNDQEVNIRQGRQHIGCGTRMSRSSTMPRVEYKNPVMTFLATPHVSEDNDQLVSLSLKIVNDEPQTGRPEEASAQLMAKDGETIVIGGLILEGQQSGEGLPAAEGERLSLLDWLLPSRPNQKTELLIFLTATVIPLNI